MPVRRTLVPLLAALFVATFTLSSSPAPAPAATDPDVNPCNDEILALKCPNLQMKPPGDLRVRKAGKVLRLLATNHIVNVGAGALELRAEHGGRATRNGYRFASASQVIHSRLGAPVFFPLAGYVYFKAIPGQGHYWKYWRAARFELWTLRPDGTRESMVRTGPKLSYCFRDLKRVRTFARSPAHRIYPACSQRFGRKELQLGVSPGWADIYPSSYHENWISITRMKGCFSFVHRADPLDDLIEEHEDDNIGARTIQLPPRRGSVAPRTCPGKTSP